MKSRSKQFNQSDETCQYLKKEQPHDAILGSGKIKAQKIVLMLWNVNGIRSVFSKNVLPKMLETYRPHFICINQTKINAELYQKFKTSLKIMGYHDYWNFCKVSAGYSGVAVYVKYAPKSIFEDLQEPQYSQQGRVLTLQYEAFYLVVVYMPSAGDKQLQRLAYKTKKYEVAFQSYCLKLKQRALSEGKNVILCGDFNTANEGIDFHQTPYSHKLPSCTPEERANFKKMLHQGWIDTFRYLHPRDRVYTWWRLQHHLSRQRNIGRRLDYFLVNKQFISSVKQAKICGEVKGSDHCPIYLKIQLPKKQQQIKEVSVIRNQEKIPDKVQTDTQQVPNLKQGKELDDQQEVRILKKNNSQQQEKPEREEDKDQTLSKNDRVQQKEEQFKPGGIKINQSTDRETTQAMRADEINFEEKSNTQQQK